MIKTIELNEQQLEFLQENLVWIIENDYVSAKAVKIADQILTRIDEAK